MRSAHAHLAGLSLKHLLKGKPRTFELYLTRDSERVPIGFTTVAATRFGRQFYDGLLLYPEHQHLWVSAFDTIMRSLPSGEYQYGWQWNLEASRSPEIQSLPGVSNLSHQDIWIQGVDFSRWNSWDSYFSDISENVRRNLRKSEGEHPTVEVTLKTKLNALIEIPTLTLMRREMCMRKSIAFNSLRVAAGYLFSTLTCPIQSIVVSAKLAGRTLSIQNLTQFGSTTYFLDGASHPEAGNIGWYLQMLTIRQAYERAPRGKYLVGHTDELQKTSIAKGLLRSRRSIRVSNWPTSQIRFKWTNPALGVV